MKLGDYIYLLVQLVLSNAVVWLLVGKPEWPTEIALLILAGTFTIIRAIRDQQPA